MSWRYRPELDGLRTFAVVIIIFFHAGVSGWSSSFIALDLFFVLSGFLVTNVVLAEMDKTGRLRLGSYYARRVRRLLPAAVFTIVTVSGLFLLISSQPERLEMIRQGQAALLYVANWQFIADGTDYFAGDIFDSPFMHFWSLSLEEQYYIVFPLLILAVLKFAPGPRQGRVMLGVFGVVAAASVASQLYWAQVEPMRAYFGTDARLFQLLAGAMLAVALREFVRRGRTADGGVSWPVVGTVLAAGGLIGYAVFGSELIAMTQSHRNLVATVLASALVLGMYTAPASIVGRVFSLSWVTWLGKISYGIYLWHWPAILALQRIFDARPIVIAAMAGVIATAMAALSYELLETPIRRSAFLDRFHWPSVIAGLSASVIAAVAIVNPVLSSPRAPVIAATTDDAQAVLSSRAADRLERPVPELEFKAVASDKGSNTAACTPVDVDACVRVDTDGPHVVLVGDSQARTMVPAFKKLAEEQGFKLSTGLVMSCPWQQGLHRADREQCQEKRAGFYDETLPAMEPDVVVLANLARSDPSWEGVLVGEDGESGDLHEMQLETTTRTMDSIEAAGARAVIVHSIMGTEGWDREGFDPLDCLARAKEQADCIITPPMDRPVVDGYYETLATRRDAVATIDINPLICPDAPYCSPIMNGRVVWRNENHLTTRVVRWIRDDIWELVEGTGFVER